MKVNTTTFYKRLAGAVLLQAVKDWKNEEHKQEVAEFLSSTWGMTITSMVNLSPERINKKLFSGEYASVPIRAGYR
ncbi:MAG: hypothetical protein AB9888_15450 [Bacteroidales bacterium]